jgi:ABC-type enterochelin transport system ATPase subunit
MIEVKNIKKGFADKIVINDVSAKLDTGKCNLIIGASGSGKTRQSGERSFYPEDHVAVKRKPEAW